MRVRVLLGMVLALAGCAAPQRNTTALAQKFPPGTPLSVLMAAAGITVGTVPVNGMPALNQSFQLSVPLFGRNMPLPPGSWTVVAVRTISARNIGVLNGSVAMVQRDGAVLRAELEVGVNTRPLGHGVTPLNPICSSSNVLWNDIVQAVPSGPQDCTVVGFERPALWRQNPNMLGYQTMNQLDQLGIQPPNMVVDLVLLESNLNWVVNEKISYNPELAGVAPDLATQPSQSAWAPFNFGKDPAKVKFVEQLKAQVPALRNELRRQIDSPAPYVPGTGLTPA